MMKLIKSPKIVIFARCELSNFNSRCVAITLVSSNFECIYDRCSPTVHLLLLPLSSPLSLLSTRRNFSCEHIFSIEICSGHAQFCKNYFAHTAFSSHKKLNHLQLLANFARNSVCMASRSNMKLGKQLRFTRTEATLLLQIAFQPMKLMNFKYKTHGKLKILTYNFLLA